MKYIIHLWSLLHQSSEQTLFDFPKKLKEKRPRVGLNHQPFGILNQITAERANRLRHGDNCTYRGTFPV